MQSLSKTKRIREVPENFEALKQLVEALIKDERELLQGQQVVIKNDRDYVIRYTDKDNELIDVSDEEDFQTAYDIAEHELGGNLKFVVDFRKPATIREGKPEPMSKDELKKLVKEMKKEKKDHKKDEKKAKKTLKKKTHDYSQVSISIIRCISSWLTVS